MRQHMKKGDLFYEPFSGDGTLLVAAESLGRVCYAMEKSQPFVAVALERLFPSTQLSRDFRRTTCPRCRRYGQLEGGCTDKSVSTLPLFPFCRLQNSP